MRLLAGVSGAARATRAVVLVALMLGAFAAVASASSLYSGPGPRPGPAILYEPTAVAPELSNTGIWQASPTLVSGTTAYRGGEFLYQDYLYDDHGARELPDPTDPRTQGDTFSKPNGTYTYPTGLGDANNAADLVEFRVKPTANTTAFRVTLNTLEDPSLIAFSIALGGKPRHSFPFPDGADVVAPADLFLTVHPSGSRLVAELVHAGTDAPVAGPAPATHLDLQHRQIEVDVPHQDWNPGQSTVRMAMGVGLWDAANGKYLLPQATADATHPGGAGTATNPAAFFNVAFRTAEPAPSVTAETGAVTNAAWWRDQQQGTALSAGDISPLFANVNFAKLASRVTDNTQIPVSGSMDRILPSHFEPAQGANYSGECGLQGAEDPSTCVPEYQGNLQPYAVYIPAGDAAAADYGITLLLHSLSANYNQYYGSRNQSEFANRTNPSIVITPEARGPDQEYEGLGAADVFEVWADIAGRYPLNPAYSDITGYSMGGIGTFKIGSQFPDLFARAQPTVGFETNNDVLASMRNLPVLMWNASADELVNASDYGQTAQKLSSLGYPYELDVYQPCANPLCSPVLPNHLMLAINDQFAPAAAFLGSSTVNFNPPHVTYLVDTSRDHPAYGIVGDHAYWVSAVTVRQSGTDGQIDLFSHGFGASDPVASGSQPGTGTLTGGNMGPLSYASLTQAWAPATPAPAGDTLDVNATNIATATIAVSRAHIDCNAKLNVTSDGPITVTVAGCNRTVQGG